ncbi:UNKNOWN [Stylonychia lemnae]|uniref:VLRF1 domain-containing protein n=1 Tax=Stylonychia lemnae TaxID=5949 RepID=A0A078B0Y4_STYLE|nr:UNKNOWN [Stylonychia lemnae]|eukprot:CDW87012.1 UNKNOWN [Stylonychia lemnae]
MESTKSNLASEIIDHKEILFQVLLHLEKVNDLRQMSSRVRELIAEYRIFQKKTLTKETETLVSGLETFLLMKELILNTKISKKNLQEALKDHPQEVKSSINHLKKCLVVKNDQTFIQTSIFDIPNQFWLSGLDSFYFKDSPYKQVSFKEFGKNRDNYEYIKEFNKLNSYAPHYCLYNSTTGDYIQINKGFIDGIADTDGNDMNGQHADKNKYHFLADSQQFSAVDIDFSDPAALLRRQKGILEAINKHMNTETFEPLKLLSRGINTYIVLLCHGGKFALNVYQGTKIIFSRTDKKYVSRGKQGGRQMNKDKVANVMSSVGSEMRRNNEKILQEHILEYMEEAKQYIEEADVIFLHAPGLNKMIFLSESQSLQKVAHKVRNIEFRSKNANFSEAQELVKKITECKVFLKAEINSSSN